MEEHRQLGLDAEDKVKLHVSNLVLCHISGLIWPSPQGGSLCYQAKNEAQTLILSLLTPPKRGPASSPPQQLLHQPRMVLPIRLKKKIQKKADMKWR